MTLKVTGIKEIIATMTDLSKRTGQTVLKRSLIKAAQPMVEMMQDLVPHDDGYLMDSIKASEPRKWSIRQYHEMSRNIQNAAEIVIGPAAPHAYLVEFGGKNERFTKAGASKGIMPPRPFARPAFEATKDEFLKILTEELRKELDLTRGRIAARKG